MVQVVLCPKSVVYSCGKGNFGVFALSCKTQMQNISCEVCFSREGKKFPCATNESVKCGGCAFDLQHAHSL